MAQRTIFNGINDEEIMPKIIKELTTQNNMSEIDSKQVLMWAQRIEALRMEKKALDKMKYLADFDHIHSGKRAKRDNEQQPKE